MKRKSYAYTPWAGIRKLIPAPAQVSKRAEPVLAASLTQDPATLPTHEPEPDSSSNRFRLEVWLNQHRPDLLAAIRVAEEEAERAWFYAEAGFPDRLAAAEAALEAAVAAGQRAMREALAGKEAEEGLEVQKGQKLTFEEIDHLFGGFERVWQLSDAQAARLEAVFQERGPVVVRTLNGKWWSAEEWYAE
ncbi:hypothetical protein [Thermodesulfitimonas autotrophica]|uniref:hypothetical protein n=1 Tax=Thermodesulfitimonas autotrophica TaxID=1894989 RepID=UPI002FE36E29